MRDPHAGRPGKLAASDDSPAGHDRRRPCAERLQRTCRGAAADVASGEQPESRQGGNKGRAVRNLHPRRRLRELLSCSKACPREDEGRKVQDHHSPVLQTRTRHHRKAGVQDRRPAAGCRRARVRGGLRDSRRLPHGHAQEPARKRLHQEHRRFGRPQGRGCGGNPHCLQHSRDPLHAGRPGQPRAQPARQKALQHEGPPRGRQGGRSHSRNP